MLVWISDLGMKKGFPEITGNPICGAKGIRTPDPLHAMEMRYQLRYSPVFNCWPVVWTSYTLRRDVDSGKSRRVAKWQKWDLATLFGLFPPLFRLWVIQLLLERFFEYTEPVGSAGEP